MSDSCFDSHAITNPELGSENQQKSFAAIQELNERGGLLLFTHRILNFTANLSRGSQVAGFQAFESRSRTGCME